MASDLERGLLAGLLIGEGHFGGDGRQPQVTLRMHVRHEALFRWIERTFPGGKLYGPYDHGGRHYLQWMARGAFLRDQLVPLLESTLSADLDAHSWRRFQNMRSQYARRLGVSGAPTPRSQQAVAAPSPGLSGPLTADEIFAKLRQGRDGGQDDANSRNSDGNSRNSSARTLDQDFTDGEDEGP